MGSPTDSQFATWTTPQCPFTIDYSVRVVDDIRLAVVDAFYSLPRGGAEIGGILLGSRDKKRVVIADYAPLECEHAYGPSFTLSDNDHAKLQELLAIAHRSGGGMVPVGWYHSHTRSEVFFSDADIAIHKKFFPEPWQIALVLKPHTFEPARAGFFFREAGGAIHGTASYREFALGPADARSLTVAAPSNTVVEQSRDLKGAGPVALAPEPSPPIDVAPPAFLNAEPPPRRGWVWALAFLTIAGIAAGGYQTRSAWLPKPPQPAPQVPTLGLTTSDQEGQLHIAWDRNSAAVRGAANGTLSISEGTQPLAVPLDQPHLQTGTFTYGRQGGRVDVSLTVQSADGRSTREATTFLGTPPAKPAPADDTATRKERDDLSKQAAALKSDLKKQAERTTNLEKRMEQMRLEMIRQQRVRMQNMNQETPKAPPKP
jgi:proteasome lid subunit RPN8/RPN11